MESVLLYPYDIKTGTVPEKVNLTTLKEESLTELNGKESGGRWFDGRDYGKTFGSYPFSGSLLRDNETYPFPMHRAPSGNWVGTPQFAYGVVYYEKNADNTLAYHVVDLSDDNVTVDRKDLSIDSNLTDGKEILDAGYAVFCKNVSDLCVKDAGGNEIEKSIGVVRDDLQPIANAIKENTTSGLNIRFIH